MDIKPEDIIQEPEYPEMQEFTHEQQHELVGWFAHANDILVNLVHELPEAKRPGEPLALLAVFEGRHIMTTDPELTLAQRKELAFALMDEAMAAIKSVDDYEQRLKAAAEN